LLIADNMSHYILKFMYFCKLISENTQWIY